MAMSSRTDAPTSGDPQTAVPSSLTRPHKPRIALAIATSLGLGYMPFAPGTWGSFVGVLIYWLVFSRFPITVAGHHLVWANSAITGVVLGAAIALLLALSGVWAADRAATFLRKKDPGCVVIDEVSGQFLTFLFALAPANWKYLLLGLILFRVFDIWKPAPARQAESLPGGLGIMADDWIAGIYAAIVLWIARAAGL
jgi:phosphatidylglycerophosphatase A